MSRRFDRAALCTAAFMAVVLFLGMWLATARAVQSPTPCFAAQQEAAARTERCMQAVRGYKQARGIALHPLDYHKTGLIGEDFNFITTSAGAIEAKRTAADPNMAALVVRLLTEAGLKPGDCVGAGFSGSFPALNLAVINACEVMELRLVYIASAGASTYGANNPALSFPEMAWQLCADGLIATPPAAISYGGDGDVGAGLDAPLRDAIRARLLALPVPYLEQPDYAANLQARMTLYARQGPIDCFVGVGGNITTLGLQQSGVGLGHGLLLPNDAIRIGPDSGLLQRYRALGLPVLNLLNMRGLCADYGLPFDAVEPPPVGQGAVYFHTVYPHGVLAAAFCIALAAPCRLWWLRRRKKKEEPPCNA